MTKRAIGEQKARVRFDKPHSKEPAKRRVESEETAAAALLRQEQARREAPLNTCLKGGDDPASVAGDKSELRVELVFNGPFAHLVRAAACAAGKTPAEWCKEIIRANVHAYMEFQHSTDSDLETIADPAAPEQALAAANADSDADRFRIVLSKPASDLVRWYCGISHHRPEWTIDGVIEGALLAAKEAYEDSPSDDSFDFVLARVLDAITQNNWPEELTLQGPAAWPRLI